MSAVLAEVQAGRHPPGVEAVVALHGPGHKVIGRGTHRTVSPEATVTWATDRFDEIGITRVANVTGLDDIGIPVVMVTRPNSRGLSVAQGKGITLDAAKASGIMECIELWHGEHLLVDMCRASAREMVARGPVLDLERLPRSDGGRLDAAMQTLWVTGVDLVSGDEVALPSELVDTDCSYPSFPRLGCFIVTSNGLASGNHPLEAALHGLCEVVERDAVALLSLRSNDERERRRIDLATVTDPDCRDVIERCRAAGVMVAAWDATSDIGLPVVDCQLFDESGDQWRPLPTAGGHGCHLTREVAFLRAVTEAAQSRLTIISGSRDDMYHHDFERATSAEVRAAAVEVGSVSGTVDFSDLPSTHHGTVAEDVTHVVRRLVACGMGQVVVVDMTRPSLGIPVCRVVVPGLEHLGTRHARYRPGGRGQAVLDAAAESGPR